MGMKNLIIHTKLCYSVYYLGSLDEVMFSETKSVRLINQICEMLLFLKLGNTLS